MVITQLGSGPKEEVSAGYIGRVLDHSIANTANGQVTAGGVGYSHYPRNYSTSLISASLDSS